MYHYMHIFGRWFPMEYDVMFVAKGIKWQNRQHVTFHTSLRMKYYTIIFVADLLMFIPNTKPTDGNVILNPTEVKSFYQQAEVVITGNPTTVASPVGNATRLTPADRVLYMFPVSAPWPCPFDINQCPSGITMSLWFRWEYFVIIPQHRRFISLGSCMYLYRPNKVYNNLLSLRWVVDASNMLFGGFQVTPGEWTHISWVVNDTHSVGYTNGSKGNTKSKFKKRLPRGLGRKLSLNEALDVGTFSVGPIHLWGGRKSPVFMWRLYQEGMHDNGELWITLIVWLTTDPMAICILCHDDVVKWKHFPCYWPFGGNLSITVEIPSQRPVARSFYVFFDLHLNKRLSKQSIRRSLETSSCSLWCHCNVSAISQYILRLLVK